jgi:anaerobic selenocysteine-containing dehydrogenase
VTVPVAPAPDCREDCRAHALLDEDRWIGLEGAEGVPPCPACVAAARALVSRDRLTSCLRARRRGATAPDELEPADANEVVEALAALLGDLAEQRRELLWIDAGRRPRASAALPLRLGALLPGVTVVERACAGVGLARSLSAMVGRPGSIDAIAEADLLLVWGADPVRHHRRVRKLLGQARRRGARLVVVDPRCSATAADADLHLPLRPGTDAAVALGLTSSTLEAAPDDPAARAWGLADAAEVSGLAPDALAALGQEVAAAERPVLLLGAGLARQANGPAAWAALARWAAASHLRLAWEDLSPDPADGLVLPPGGGRARRVASGKLADELARRDPVRDIVVVAGGDPLAELPASAPLVDYMARARRVVVLATRWSAVCGAADIVVAVHGHLEEPEVLALRGRSEPWRAAAALAAPRGALAPSLLWRRVARRGGLPERWFPADTAELIDEARPPEHGSAATAPAAAPEHRELGEGPLATPDTWRGYRLFLVAGDGSARLGAPQVTMAPADARDRGLATSQPVLVHNERGRLHARAQLDPAQPSGAVGIAEPPGASGHLLGGLLPDLAGEIEVWGPCLVEVSPDDGGDR